MAQDLTEVERAVGCCGELVLLRRDGQYEIVANGVFLMDTRGGGSERLHVRVAADRMPQPGRMLIGGLGVGFSLAAALAHPGVGEVHVVEREPAVLRWNRGPLASANAGALSDPRVRTYEADVVEWLANAAAGSLDAICLDVDNGPGWLVTPGNAWLYADEGLRTAARVLSPDGVLTIWSAAPAPAFVARMNHYFAEVETIAVSAARGEPDVIVQGRVPLI
jgi:spermidine synthase